MRPVLLFFACILVSLLANPHRVAAVSTDVIKTLLFFASFFLLYWLVASLLRHRRDIDLVVGAIVISASAVALAGAVEWRTHYNVFDHLQPIFPFLRFGGRCLWRMTEDCESSHPRSTRSLSVPCW